MLPSRIAPNTTLPAVASTPLVSEPWKILKSHIVLPVSGSSALMPADAAGSPGFGRGGSRRRGAADVLAARLERRGGLTYAWPLSGYSR